MSETITPIRAKAQYFYKYLKKVNRDYHYLRELFHQKKPKYCSK